MEEKYLVIITEILANPSITRKELEKKLGLSKDQIKYAINKINDYLEENKLPPIARTKSGCFIIDGSLSMVVDEEHINLDNADMFFSEEERIIIILLLLFNEALDLSLEYFSYELKVSKNTVLRDINKVKMRLVDHGLTIAYSRIAGYSILGNELVLRDFLKEILFQIIKMSTGSQLLVTFSGIQLDEQRSLENKLKLVEETLEIRYTDEQYQVLPYFLSLIFQRIDVGKSLENRRSDEEDVLNLAEVKIIEDIMALGGLDNREKIYIALQLLTSTIFSADTLNARLMAQLKKVLVECIRIFETKTSINFKETTQLLNSLMYHLTPAYYRIKYRVNEKNELYEKEFFDNIVTQYDYLNTIIKECFKPLAEFLGVPLPEVEIMYISLIFGSKILPQGKSQRPKLKTAIIICPKGITYSQLMLSQLIALFPEVYFYEPVSHRSFRESNLKVDIVFSIGHFHAYENCFVVKATMTKSEKQQLRSNVFKRIFGVDDQYNLLEKIMVEISPFVPGNQQSVVKNRITEILGQKQLTNQAQREQLTHQPVRLWEFLSTAKIAQIDQIADYREAIRLAGKPLLEAGLVTKDYLDKVIEAHDFTDPYTILGSRLAIPHAHPQDGVKGLGISLLIVKEGVLFSEKQRINLIFLLAPVDNKQHNQAIIDILAIAESSEIITELLAAVNTEQVLKIIKKNI